MSPIELLESRTIHMNDINDSELMQTTLSQYQTPAYLAKYVIMFQRQIINLFLKFRPEEDQVDDDIIQQQARNLASIAR